MNNSSRIYGFGLAGFFLGGFIGFLLRPSAMLIGQLSFGQVITRGTNFQGVDTILVPLAERSFNIMLAGALICGILGLVLARMTSK